MVRVRGDCVDWSEERIADLSRRWNAGETVLQISHNMGISKNAVVGKARRLNLPGRESPIRRSEGGPKPQPPPRVNRAATLPPLPTAQAPEAPGMRLVLASVPDQDADGPMMPREAPRLAAAPGQPLPRPEPGSRFACSWPIGEPGTPGFEYCGEHIVRGRSYCPDHHAVATMSSRSLAREGATLATIEAYALQHNVVVPPRTGLSGLIVAVNNHRRGRQLTPFVLRASAA